MFRAFTHVTLNIHNLAAAQYPNHILPSSIAKSQSTTDLHHMHLAIISIISTSMQMCCSLLSLATWCKERTKNNNLPIKYCMPEHHLCMPYFIFSATKVKMHWISLPVRAINLFSKTV